MASKKNVEVFGLKFIEDQLAGFFPRESKAIMRRSTTKIAATIRNGMRKRAPRDSGTLRKAIVSKRKRGRPGLIEAAVYITKGLDAKHDAFYWHMVEYGTVHSRAQPFAQPVVESTRATYQGDLAKEIDRQVIKQMEKRAKRQRLKR